MDLQTNFCAARFLNGESLDEVRSTFLHCWASIYTGYPDVIKADQGSIFTTPRFEDLTSNTGIKLELSDIEHHNGLSAGEKYHDPLRRIFSKILFDYSDADKDLAISLAVCSITGCRATRNTEER